MNRFSIALLTFLVAVLGLGSLLTQVVFLPVIAAETASANEQLAHLQVPYLVLGIAVVLCAQLALVALWRLLRRTAAHQTFHVGSLRWVILIEYAGWSATALLAAGFAYRLIAIEPGPDFYIFGAAIVCSTGFALLVNVMKRLLVSAIDQSNELAQVI